MTELTFITGNPAKAKYLSEHFHIPIKHQALNLAELQSLDLKEIVQAKARAAFEIIKTPVLVEDVSLVFTALKKLPGPLIKWFLETLGNEGLCRLVDGGNDRGAMASVAFAFCDGGEVEIFPGSVEGKIADKPRGTTNFGWDPIFIPLGHEKTWAEMTGEEKHASSMRKIALAKLTDFLNSA